MPRTVTAYATPIEATWPHMNARSHASLPLKPPTMPTIATAVRRKACTSEKVWVHSGMPAVGPSMAACRAVHEPMAKNTKAMACTPACREHPQQHDDAGGTQGARARAADAPSTRRAPGRAKGSTGAGAASGSLAGSGSAAGPHAPRACARTRAGAGERKSEGEGGRTRRRCARQPARRRGSGRSAERAGADRVEVERHALGATTFPPIHARMRACAARAACPRARTRRHCHRDVRVAEAAASSAAAAADGHAERGHRVSDGRPPDRRPLGGGLRQRAPQGDALRHHGDARRHRRAGGRACGAGTPDAQPALLAQALLGAPAARVSAPARQHATRARAGNAAAARSNGLLWRALRPQNIRVHADLAHEFACGSWPLYKPI